MKILISEQQFTRMKKGMDCNHIVKFGFRNAGWGKYGRRYICVDDHFYDLLNNYSMNTIGVGDIPTELKNLILKYYFDTYHWEPYEITINGISGGKDARVDIVYRYKEINEDTKTEPDKTAKWIKCRNCKKKFTQTIHNGKEGSKICPYCHTHN